MGNYKVVITEDAEEVLEWEGYAENPSDALYHAMAKREDEIADEQ